MGKRKKNNVKYMFIYVEMMVVKGGCYFIVKFCVILIV